MGALGVLCRMVVPIIEGEVQVFCPDIKLVKSNVDRQPEHWQVNLYYSIPTLLVMKEWEDQIFKQVSGARDLECILEMLCRRGTVWDF